ncbi:MAG: SDR family oxidoreductase [Chloroflexia bacterium]|nr:SDR family oxidoreductase [Chloroflexia bacterium]
MDLGLTGRTALVAAASRGLGKAIAWELAREGAAVAICARGKEQLKQTAAEIAQDTGSRVLALAADVSVARDVFSLVDAVMQHLGGIDILVNNAGGPPPGPFLTFSDEDWRAALDLNLLSAVRLSRAVIPHMQQCGWGRIINLTSVAAKQPIPDLVLSNAARSGVIGLSKTLALELAASGITVNSVCPGFILTDRVRQLFRARAEKEGHSVQEIQKSYERQIPQGRLGRPQELAALVAFLASEQAGYITGTAIQLDGGYVRGLF